MALGDGTVWNEAAIDDTTVAHQIDDYHRELMVAVRSRMAVEHLWPAAGQTATNEAGFHAFLTFSAQTATPGLIYETATQQGALFVTTTQELIFLTSDSASVTLIDSANQSIPILGSGGTGTLGGVIIASSANPVGVAVLAASASGYMLVTNTNTATPSWVSTEHVEYVTAPASKFYVAVGSTSWSGAGSTVTVTFPITFATNPGVSVGVHESGAQVDDHGRESDVHGVSTSEFKFRNTKNSSGQLYWSAIGRSA